MSTNSKGRQTGEEGLSGERQRKQCEGREEERRGENRFRGAVKCLEENRSVQMGPGG